jgi:hypothetical protein
MATSEIDRITDELHRAWDGDCWHGQPLQDVLREVTAGVAAVKHPQLAHSIWGLVHHLTVWVEVVRLRIGRPDPLLEPDRGNFPPVTDSSPEAWESAVRELGSQIGQLRELVGTLSPAALDEIVPGKDDTVVVALHGTAQHLAYHAGQIALLKKLVG